MKAYKVELLVIDFDDLGEDGIRDEIENAKYANRCISPSVQKMDSRDIGEWTDDHPLNNRHKARTEYKRIFETK
jgi:hypothetical protein